MAIASGDGSIILTTEVDTSGINKGTKNINNAISSSSKAMRALGNELNVALSKGDSKQAQLIMSYQKATKAVEEELQKVQELKAQLQGLESGEIKVQDKGVLKLQSDLEKANATIEKTQNEVDQLYVKLNELQLQAFKDPTTQEPVFTPKEQVEFDKINSDLDNLEVKLESTKKEAQVLGVELKNAMNITTQQEIGNVSMEIEKAKNRLTELGLKAEQAGNKLRNNMEKSSDPVGKVTEAFGKLGDRIFGLARRVFVFSMITKALRSLRSFLGTALMSNEGFRNSLAQLQGQLWVAFSPIYSYILPALQSLINFLTLAMSYVNQFISLLTGKSVASMAASAQQLKEQSDAYKDVGSGASKAAKGMKKTTEEAKKQLAAFDDLQVLTENKDEDTSNDSGAGAGAVGGTDGIGSQIQNLSGDITAELLVIMGAIGAALAAVGLILLFVGHPLLGVGFMLVGAAVFGVSMASLMKGDYVGEIDTTLAVIMAIAGLSLVAIGLILLLLGQTAWGIGFLIAGAGDLAVIAIAASKGALSEDAKEIIGVLATIMGVAGGALLALGIILLYIGGVVGKGVAIGMIIAGAALIVSAVATEAALNPDDIQGWLSIILGIAGGALLALGVILCMVGSIPIGVGMIIAGSVALVSAVALHFDKVTDKITGWVAVIMAIAGAALLVLGIVLCATGAGIALGIALIAAGAIALATPIALNWDFIKTKTSKIFNAVFNWIKTWGLLVLGIILCITGVGLPLGIALIQKGAANLTEAQDPMWNAITDKVKEIWKSIQAFWDENIAPIFTAKWWLDLGKMAINGLAQGFEAGINGIITMFENMINWIADQLNKFKIDIPDWIPGVGGKSFGFNLSHVKFNRVSIPRLAQGTVIPPNHEFMAILGDQKHGTNIEAPLATIEEAVRNVLSERNDSGTNQTIILQLDGREVGRTFGQAIQNETRRTGASFVKPKIVFG